MSHVLINFSGQSKWLSNNLNPFVHWDTLKRPYCFRVEQPDNKICRSCREYQNTKNCNERDEQGYSESLWIGEMRFEDDYFSLARNTELLPMYCSSVMNQCMHSSTKDAIWEKQSKFLYETKFEDLKPISIIYEEHRFRIVKLSNCPKWSWDCSGNLHFATSNPLSPEKSPRVWFSSILWVRKALSIPIFAIVSYLLLLGMNFVSGQNIELAWF